MKNDYMHSDFYKSFNKVNRLNKFDKLSQKQYSDTIALLHKKIIDAIIFDNYEYRIKHIGSVLIIKDKQDVLVVDGKVKPKYSVDQNKTRELGRKVYHENKNTNGYIFKIKFHKQYNSRARRFFFKPTRYKFKRYLASLLKDTNININAIELR